MSQAQNQTESQKKGFSIALGLVDYINPIAYSINTFLIAAGLKAVMSRPQFGIYLGGIILSLIIGLVIPTCKLLVGLGKLEFRLPFALFMLCNLGIFITGAAILSTIASPTVLIIVLVIMAALLGLLWKATGKFNSAILFTGTFGYTMIYVSLAIIAAKAAMILPIIFFVLAFGIMIGLILFSMKADLTNPKLHWWIEGFNILSQILLCIGLIILF